MELFVLEHDELGSEDEKCGEEEDEEVECEDIGISGRSEVLLVHRHQRNPNGKGVVDSEDHSARI